jgi:hypothetical protein
MSAHPVANATEGHRRYCVRSVGDETHDEFAVFDLRTDKAVMLVGSHLTDTTMSRREAEEIAHGLNRQHSEWESTNV